MTLFKRTLEELADNRKAKFSHALPETLYRCIPNVANCTIKESCPNGDAHPGQRVS